jgi:hypothetical protein
MINKKAALSAALESVEGVEGVFFYYPKSFKKLPCVSYYENNNSPARAADDAEYLTEINYQVDVWAEKSAEASEIAGRVNAALTAAGFTREFSHDLYEPGAAAHKTMRYQYIGG